MEAFLQTSSIIDWQSHEILERASTLRGGSTDDQEVTRSCFEWVRDEIQHSGDAELPGEACVASEVLAAGNGWCFAKSHLLAALLRANAIPTGFCYQRLRYSEEQEAYTLHGLNAVYLEKHGWYRIDPRGNKHGIDAQCTPPEERLAWPIQEEGEQDFPGIYAEPLSIVCGWLKSNETHKQAVCTLPDPKTLPRAQLDLLA